MCAASSFGKILVEPVGGDEFWENPAGADAQDWHRPYFFPVVSWRSATRHLVSRRVALEDEFHPLTHSNGRSLGVWRYSSDGTDRIACDRVAGRSGRRHQRSIRDGSAGSGPPRLQGHRTARTSSCRALGPGDGTSRGARSRSRVVAQYRDGDQLAWRAGHKVPLELLAGCIGCMVVAAS